jgi:hypothetical protein
MAKRYDRPKPAKKKVLNCCCRLWHNGFGNNLVFMTDFKELDGRLAELARQGKVIEAIQVYRENTGMGLKESKDYVEQLMAKKGIVPPAPKLRLGRLLPVLLLSVVLGVLFVTLAGLVWPVLFNVSAPFVCSGALHVTQETAPGGAGTQGVQTFIYCMDAAGKKTDVSMSVSIVSGVIYSLIAFVVIMVLVIMKGKKIIEAREKGLSV